MGKNANDIVVLGGSRTPFSKFGGTLRDWSSSDLGAYFLPKAIDKMGITPDQIDYVVCASSLQSEVANQGNTMARQILVKAGFMDIPSTSTDQASCSGLTAVELAYRLMMAADYKLVAVIGTEAMSNCSFIVLPDIRWGKTKRGEIKLIDPITPIRSSAHPAGAIAAVDHEAELFDVTREDMDLWAYETQMRFEKARQEGFFADEIIPVELEDGTFMTEDDTPKPWSNMPKIRSLKTVGTSKTVTAANSPGLETGVAVTFLAKRSYAEELGLKPLARIIDSAVTAGPLECPLSMGAKAATKLLNNRDDIKIEDIDVIEAEEDFAAVVPISARYFERELGANYDEILKKTNPNGGAVAVGHPIATGGVRIFTTMVREMQRKGHKYGMCIISGGLSQGVAVLVEAE